MPFAIESNKAMENVYANRYQHPWGPQSSHFYSLDIFLSVSNSSGIARIPHKQPHIHIYYLVARLMEKQHEKLKIESSAKFENRIFFLGWNQFSINIYQGRSEKTCDEFKCLLHRKGGRGKLIIEPLPTIDWWGSDCCLLKKIGTTPWQLPQSSPMLIVSKYLRSWISLWKALHFKC